MASHQNPDQNYGRSVKRLIFGLCLALFLGIFLLWRIDNPRVEKFRMALVDSIVPRFDWLLIPVAKTGRMLSDFQSYTNIYAQNQELRRELQRLKSWREAALQLEQKNAKLLDLNHVRISPKLTFVTGVVLADSGSPFRQSALINIGRRDGVRDGWAAMDGLGLVGRISGVGAASSRVILLTDSSSNIAVTIEPSGQHAIVTGINTPYPVIDFAQTQQKIHPGDRVMTSGEAGALPPSLLVGQVVLGHNGRFLVRLAADLEQLEFLRVLRARPGEHIGVSNVLVGPLAPERQNLNDGLSGNGG